MRFFLILFLLSSTLYSQEVLSPLNSNPNSYNYISSKNTSALLIPFFDDFSYQSNILDNNLWLGNSTLVNRNYPINPPTIGVVTLDGLDSSGFAYDISLANNHGVADVLLSQMIDLSNLDSVFLMFYHQPQGYGDNPQSEDSLFLEYLSIDSLGFKVWTRIWELPGEPVSEFKKTVIMITDPKYLHDSFQFRFRNYATLSGNFDHWHLDYIILDQYTSSLDTSGLNDVAFVYNSPSFLKRYKEMPWIHFQDDFLGEINDSVNILLRNNQASINVDYQYNVYENNIIIDHYPNLGTSRNTSVLDYDSIGNYTFENPSISINNNIFPSNFKDSSEFIIEHIIGTGSNDYKNNDTLIHYQRFNSHFSYDDGSVESAYGINVQGAMGAYQFKLNRPDTLRAVQIYFPQMLDTVNAISFLLTVWDDNNGNPGSIIHQQLEYPVHTSTNQYHFYYLDSLFQLTDIFYVGWTQNSSSMLNIGLDKNSIANDYMFYNVGGLWNTSQYSGAWMIRPLVSMSNLYLNNNNNNNNNSVKIFPNPSSSYVTVQTFSSSNLMSLFDLSGKMIFQKSINEYYKFDSRNFKSGIYILKIQNHLGVFNRKLIFY
ncbi:MAG: T9SS type A sorting domain-containing protein [Gammaproteobacteria bacterium]|nr:T9SS type A sorting domain-containing protein [Gammaproteobacteria bacterium]